MLISAALRSTFVGAMVAAAALWNAVPARAQSDLDALRVAPTRELRAALIASNPVLVTRGTDGQLGGVSVELARALAAKLGVLLRDEFVDPVQRRPSISRPISSQPDATGPPRRYHLSTR